MGTNYQSYNPKYIRQRLIKKLKESLTNKDFEIMNDNQFILFHFHHIHHLMNIDEKILIDEHKTHHCGITNNSKSYEIRHCQCGKHAIDTNIALAKTLDFNGETIFLMFEFKEECKANKWTSATCYHLESGKLIKKLTKKDIIKNI